MSEKEDAGGPVPKKKKGGIVKIALLVVGVLVLVGGGVGGGLYLSQSGLMSAHAEAPDAHLPKLVPKAEEKRASLGGDGEHGGEASEPSPPAAGAEKYASNYYVLDKPFTANLQDSVHFIQVGLAISTPYDDRVLVNLKTHEIAVRSAVLMALSDTDENQVFTAQGKEQLQKRLAKAINNVLQQKEGFGGVSNVYFTNFVVQ